MLLHYNNSILQKKVFKLVKPKQINIIQLSEIEEEEKERYVQIKIHSTQINDQNQYVIQIIDFSLNIINQKIETLN